MNKTYIEVKHNFEAAHRMFDMPGKCQRIHGHSFWTTLRLYGDLSSTGMVVNHYGKSLEFGEVKHLFRGFLDSELDHSLLLNRNDPWAKWSALYFDDTFVQPAESEQLPGLVVFDGDPTTEFLAKYIGEWASKQYGVPHLNVTVQETSVNAAGIEIGDQYDRQR